ncbi:hypothetical protein C8R43DRAFT_1125843 [Mycena crocata]|nr:hypothetical protein C8R43DRAFT_1125843 [Mycena crocata]
MRSALSATLLDWERKWTHLGTEREVRAETGCRYPQNCYAKARALLDALHAKWDPRRPQPEDYEEAQAPAALEEDESVEFDSRITTHGTIADTFRIFTKGNPRNLSGASPMNKHDEDTISEGIDVYTDGSAINNGRDNARAGAGVYFGEGDPRNMAIRIPDAVGKTNNVGEMVAIKTAADECLPEIPNLRKWEDGGFFGVENGKLIQATVASLRRRKAKTTFKKVQAHVGIPGNEAADELANNGSAKLVPDTVSVKPAAAFTLPGAKLQAMTQSSAYKIIRKLKMNKGTYQRKLARKATTENMAYAKAATDDNDEVASAKTIWKSTRHKDVSRSIRFFLWMLIHDGYKVGKHWDNIPGHEDKGPCSVCRESETMQHILTRCKGSGQEQVWELASEIWKLKTGEDLPKPVMGQIMACAAIKRRDAGTSRLFRIVVSESAHLIWRIRCERVLKEEPVPTRNELHNRWMRAINGRLQMDCELTNKRKYEKKALLKEVVQNTWSKVLKDETNLPKDWTRETGVLVGIG